MELVWEGLFYSASGYADAARSYALALREANVRIRIRPLDAARTSCLSGSETQLFREMQETRVSPFAPYIQHIQPQHYTVESAGRAVLRIGYTVFETDRIPHHWTAYCNQKDEIWVPCTFNQATFADAGVIREQIHVLPHAIDTQRFRPDVCPLPLPYRYGFQFLSLFHFQRRKGWDVLLRAYLRAFRSTDDVCLILKTTGEHIEESLRELIEEECGSNAIPALQLNTETLPREKMPALFAAADCFVLPSRGEGFGLPIAEAMACGLPVITTDWGGVRDFVSEQNGYSVHVEKLVPPDDWFCAMTKADTTHRWAEPDVDHLCALLRHVYEHREEARAKGQAARTTIEEQFSYAQVAERIRNRLAAAIPV
jgi:glycosyltransferase involved in cell wall biosynthesis